MGVAPRSSQSFWFDIRRLVHFSILSSFVVVPSAAFVVVYFWIAVFDLLFLSFFLSVLDSAAVLPWKYVTVARWGLWKATNKPSKRLIASIPPSNWVRAIRIEKEKVKVTNELTKRLPVTIPSANLLDEIKVRASNLSAIWQQEIAMAIALAYLEARRITSGRPKRSRNGC